MILLVLLTFYFHEALLTSKLWQGSVWIPGLENEDAESKPSRHFNRESSNTKFQFINDETKNYYQRKNRKFSPISVRSSIPKSVDKGEVEVGTNSYSGQTVDDGSGTTRNTFSDAGNHKYASLKYPTMGPNESSTSNSVVEGQVVYAKDAIKRRVMQEIMQNDPSLDAPENRDVIFNKMRRLAGWHPTLNMKAVSAPDDEDGLEDEDPDIEEETMEDNEEEEEEDTDDRKKKKKHYDKNIKQLGHGHKSGSSEAVKGGSKAHQSPTSGKNKHESSNSNSHQHKENTHSGSSDSDTHVKTPKASSQTSSAQSKIQLSGSSKKGENYANNGKTAAISPQTHASSISVPNTDPAAQHTQKRDDLKHPQARFLPRISWRLKPLYESYDHSKRDSVSQSSHSSNISEPLNTTSPAVEETLLEMNSSLIGKPDIVPTTHNVTGEVMGYLTQLKDLIKNTVSNQSETGPSSSGEQRPASNSSVFQRLWRRLSDTIQSIFPHPEPANKSKDNVDETRSTIWNAKSPEKKQKKTKYHKKHHMMNNRDRMIKKKHGEAVHKIYKRSSMSEGLAQESQKNIHLNDGPQRTRFGRNTVKKMLAINDRNGVDGVTSDTRKVVTNDAFKNNFLQIPKHTKRAEIRSSSFKDFSQSLDKMIDEMFKNQQVSGLSRDLKTLSDKNSNFPNYRDGPTKEAPGSVDSSNWDDSLDYERSLGINDEAPFSVDRALRLERNDFEKSLPEAKMMSWSDLQPPMDTILKADERQTTSQPSISLRNETFTIIPSVAAVEKNRVSANVDDYEQPQNISSFVLKTWNNTNNLTLQGISGSIYSPQANLTLEIRPEITISVKNTQINNPRSLLQPKVSQTEKHGEDNDQMYQDNPSYQIYQKYYRSYYGIQNITQNSSSNNFNVTDHAKNSTAPVLYTNSSSMISNSSSIPLDAILNITASPSSVSLEKSEASPYLGPVIPLEIEVTEEVDDHSPSSTETTEDATSAATSAASDDDSSGVVDSIEGASEWVSTSVSPDNQQGLRSNSKFMERPIDRFLKMLKSLRNGNVHDKKSMLS